MNENESREARFKFLGVIFFFFRSEEMKNESWASILSSVIEMCFVASAIASPVVTCDSPEGFLPGCITTFFLVDYFLQMLMFN